MTAVSSLDPASSVLTSELPLLDWDQIIGYRRAYFGSVMDNLRRLGAAAGDIAGLTVLEQSVVLVNAPVLVREVLITRAEEFSTQNPRLPAPTTPVSMLQCHGAAHHRARRQVSPAFRPRHFAAYADTIAECADRLQSGWCDGAIIPIGQEMNRLALNVIGKTVLDRDGMGEGDKAGKAQTLITQTLEARWSPVRLPLPWRIPPRKRVLQAHAALTQAVQGTLRERRESGRRGDDMVSVILESQQEDAADSDEELAVQIIGLLTAGTVNVAKSLAWAVCHLAQCQEDEERVRQEADTACLGTLPVFDDLPALPYSRQVYQEALRTMPRKGVVQRWCVDDTELGGYRLPKGAPVFIFPYLLHHDPQNFPEPQRFDPGRFAPGWEQTRPRHAFIPFGDGAHACIGGHFTLMEAQIILAVLSRRVSLHLVPGQGSGRDVLSTLNPRHDVRLRVQRHFCGR